VSEPSSSVNAPAAAAAPPNGPLSLKDRVRSLRLPDRASQPPARMSWLPWVLCLLFAATTAILALSAFGRSGQDPVRPDSSGPSSSERIASGTDKSCEKSASPGEVVLEAKGYIVPRHQIMVSPKVGGMVIKLNVEEGMRVKKGDVLAQLETVEYDSDFHNAKGVAESAWQRWLELASGNREEEIEQARAELEENEANREAYFLDWKRSVDLKRGQVLAPKDYEQAYSSFRTTDRKVERLRLAYKLMKDGARAERIDAAWADVVQAEANLTKAKWRLDNCTILAPVTGTILTKKAEEGNVVNPVAFNIAASICEMADLADMEVDLAIAERDIHRVFNGQKCEMRAEAFSKRVYPGFVSRLMPTADRAKGAVPVRVKILLRDKQGKFTLPDDDEGKFLRPDMGAIVRFLNVASEGAVLPMRPDPPKHP
jgi:multidrug resistance efflux pump